MLSRAIRVASKISTAVPASRAPAATLSAFEGSRVLSQHNVTVPNPTKASAKDAAGDRVYNWIDAEAEYLIAKAYARHASPEVRLPVQSVTVAELEKLGQPVHYVPRTFLDNVAYGTMRFLRVFTHGFFRERYSHHAVVLETVAAVPGIVAAAFRHLRSLRSMERDHNWIGSLQEEAENERMHLLIWMQYTKPTAVERGLVVLAQLVYLTFYAGLYAVSPQSAHRMVGYLEEEAHIAYTAFLGAIDSGALPNNPAPAIAKKYYNLPENATIRDVVLHVRADECMHRDFNHMLAEKVRKHDTASAPYFMGVDAVEAKRAGDGKAA